MLQTFHPQGPSKTSKRLTFGQHFSLEHFKPSPQQSKGLTVHSTGKPSQHPASSPHQHLISLWQGSVTCTDRGRLSSGGGHFCLLTFCFLAVLKGTVTALAGGHYPLTTNCAQATLKNNDQEHALRASCYSFRVFPLEGDVIFHSSKGSSWGWLQTPGTVTRSPCLLSTKSALSNWTARCMVPNHSA